MESPKPPLHKTESLDLDASPASLEKPPLKLENMQRVMGKSPLSTRQYFNLAYYTKLQFKICNFIHSLYFTRDDKSGEVSLLKSKWHLGLVKLHVLIHWSFSLFAMGYFIMTIGYNYMSEKLLAYAFLASWLCCAVMQTEFWRHREDAIFLFKSIMDFEKKYLPAADPNKPVKKDKVMLILMILGILSSFGLPGMMTVMLLADPCRPPHLGYILFKHGLDKCIVPNIGAQVIVLAADIYMWTIALPHGFFYVFQALLVGVRCQDLYLRMLRWGQKQDHKGISKSEREEICLKVYREILMVNKLHNIVFKAAFFPAVITVGIFVAIMGMFACLKLRDVIPFPAILFFPNIACDGLSIIFIAKIAGLTYIQAKGFLNETQKNFQKGRKGWQMKVFKSLDKVKIRFGGNFVDEMTPLVFLDFCFTQTVQLMLLTDK